MRRLLRFGLYFLSFIVAVALLAVVILYSFFPRDIPVSNLVVSKSEEAVERGRYLVNHVAFCLSCHATRDWDFQSGPVVAGTIGRGGSNDLFGGSDAPGANITPYKLSTWSDGEIKRAITSGLKPSGARIHPEMPYFIYRDLATTDVDAIVAYLRTLQPIAYDPEPPQWSFLLAAVARALPKPYEEKPLPEAKDTIARGRYLVRIADCRSCHGSDFSGGISMQVPGGVRVTSANLTPDLETGLGGWNREAFIAFFKIIDNPEAKQRKPARPEFNSVMPWTQYAGMSREDLGAIFDYLASLEPVVNQTR